MSVFSSKVLTGKPRFLRKLTKWLTTWLWITEVDLARAAHKSFASRSWAGGRFNNATDFMACRAPLRVMPAGRLEPAEIILQLTI